MPMFCVIYRWRLHAGMEDAFVAAWARLTDAIRARRRGLGSRLHRTGDQLWLAYAQWPDRGTWEAAGAAESPDPGARAAMAAAIAERFDPILLDTVSDRLVALAAGTSETPR
jgi:hypothetical protein